LRRFNRSPPAGAIAAGSGKICTSLSMVAVGGAPNGRFIPFNLPDSILLFFAAAAIKRSLTNS